jgi:chemotaxis signal transduction protein
MDTLIVINLGGQPYGVWEDDVLRTSPVASVHSLPMTPPHFAGVADIGERTASLYDISASMGHERLDKSRPCVSLIVTDSPSPMGYAYNSDGGRLSATRDELHPLPGGMRSEAIEGILVRDGDMIVILNIKHIFSQATSDKWSPPSLEFRAEAKADTEGYRLFKAGGQSFAVSSRGMSPETQEIGKVFHLPIAPEFIAGFTLAGGKPSLLLDTPLRLGMRAEPGKRLIHTDDSLSIAVDSDLGTPGIDASDVLPLPQLARGSLMDSAIAGPSDITPVLKLHELLLDSPAPSFENMYKGRSGFLDALGSREVDMTEFPLLGEICGIPGEQVEDVTDFTGYRSIPGIHSIMIGVAPYKGALLPVLDLALCFGLRSVIKPDWKLIVIKNGEFRAMVPSREVSDKFTLTLEEQQRLPINQRYRYVYGCYTIESKVRLMLNVKTLTTHFDEALVSKVFESFYKDLEETEWAVTATRYEKAEAAARREAEESEEEAPDLAELAAAYLSTPVITEEEVETKEAPEEEAKGEPAEEEAERLAKEEADRIAAEEEAERLAKEEADRIAADEEAERLAKEEADRIAAEEEAERLAKEEADRIAAEQEAERLAKEEADRIAAEQEAERLAKEEADRIAAEQEAERLAKEEADRIAAEQEEAERLAKEEADRIAAEQEAERLAQEEADRIAAEEEAKKKSTKKTKKKATSKKKATTKKKAAKKVTEEEAARLAREEADRKAAEEEAERLAQEEAEKKAAEEEGERLAREEADRKAAEEEAERLAREEADRIAAEEEAERLAQEEADRIVAEEEAERLAQPKRRLPSMRLG